MGVKGSSEWKKLNRELKILQAKQKASALLPKEKNRLEWLEQRLGEAAEVTRVRIDEEQDKGPKKLTSDDHWATEVSEELLQDAEDFKAQKAWEKDVAQKKAKFQATDSRQGKQTFKQKGLSPFAIDLTADLKSEGFQDEPVEEEEAAEKRAVSGRVNYAKEEAFEEAGATGTGTNPFAVGLDPALAGALGQFADSQPSVVPDTVAKSFETDLEADLPAEPVDFTRRVDEGSREVQGLFAQGTTEPEGVAGLSLGEMTTHSAEQDEGAGLDYDLMKSAMEYAEERGLDEEASEMWAVDEQGQELEYSPDEQSDDVELPTKTDRPPPQRNAGAVLIPDPPPEPDDAEEPTAIGGVPDGVADLYSTAEPTLPGENEPGEASIPDMSDDMSGEYAVNLWVEPEEDLPEPAPEPKRGEAAYQPAPTPDDDAGWAPISARGGEVVDFEEDIDLSESADDAAGGGTMDSFWGLAEEPAPPKQAQVEPTIIRDQAQPAVEPTSLRQEPFPDQAAAPRGAASRPLPALNLDAARVQPTPKPAPQPAARQVQQAPRAKGFGLDRADQLLTSLFGEHEPAASKAAPAEDLEPIIIGPAPKRGAATAAAARPATAAVGRGVSRQPVSQANDLSGPRRATVHFRDGVNRRGLLHEFDTDSDSLLLHPQPNTPGKPEKLAALALKAVFLMLPRGLAYPDKQGYFCKLLMIDGRKLEGYSPDYNPARKAFTLFPTEDSGNIERVLVFNEAVKNIWFPEE